MPTNGAARGADRPPAGGGPLFEQACADAAVGLCLVAPDGRFLRVNRALCELLGHSEEELLATTFSTVTHPDDLPETVRLHRRLRRGDADTVTIEKRYLHRSGDPVWARTTVSAVRDPETGAPRYLIAQVHDARGPKRAEERIRDLARRLETANRRLARANLALQEMAATDPLTGLANRRTFDRRLLIELRRANRSGEPLSLLYLDLDRFKSYNDRFGHPAGDELLIKLGALLARTVRGSDTVARVGGEELIVLTPETDTEGAVTLGEKLRRAVAEELAARRPVTVSVGASTLHLPPDGPLDLPAVAAGLIAAADRALYRAKEAGRNRVVHDEPLPAGPQVSAG